MTVVNPSVILSPIEGSPRGQPGALVIAKKGKLDWSTKAVIIRNAPGTIWHPTIRQAAMRYLFGSVGQWTKGMKGTTSLPMNGHKIPAGTRVPKPTATIQVVLKNQVNSYIPESTFPRFTGKTRRHAHDIGMLAVEIQKAGKTPPSVAKEAVLEKAKEKGIISDEEYKKLMSG
jgi:hypothetical protein